MPDDCGASEDRYFKRLRTSGSRYKSICEYCKSENTTVNCVNCGAPQILDSAIEETEKSREVSGYCYAYQFE